MNHDPKDSGFRSPTGQELPLATNLKSKAVWLRLFFMLVVLFLYSVSRVVVGAVIVLQFFWVLLSGRKNAQLAGLGQALATYTYQIVRYLTFVTDERPFPFDVPWPSSAPR